MTDKQAALLAYWVRHERSKGMPPTHAEAQKALGYENASSITSLATALRRKEMLEWHPEIQRGAPRSIRATPGGRAYVDALVSPKVSAG